MWPGVFGVTVAYGKTGSVVGQKNRVWDGVKFKDVGCFKEAWQERT